MPPEVPPPAEPPRIPPDLEYRSARPEDADRILEILNGSFASWPPCEAPLGQRRYLEWLLDHPPSAWGAQASVALVEGSIAAVSMSAGRQYLIFGEPRRGSRTGTSAVHPDYRGLRVATALANLRADRYQHWGYGWTLAPAYVHMIDDRPAYFRPQNPLTIFLRVFDPLAEARAQAGSTLREAAAYAPFAAVGALRALGSRSGRAPEMTIRQADHFDERFEALSLEAARDFDMIPVRAPAEYDWRYLDERGGRFELFVAESGETLLGYFVIAMRWQRGHVVDILAPPGRQDIVRALLAAAARECRARGAASVECWMAAKHPYAGVLRSLGYLPARSRTAVMAGRFSLSTPPESPHDLRDRLGQPDARLHVVQGDCNEI